MSVRIRMKKFGRRHRPFFRICAMDQRAPRNGRVLEELGTYDPMVPEVDARTQLNAERVQYWLGVGAQPSDKVGVLIKKYGPEGTHLKQQAEACERLSSARRQLTAAPTVMPKPVQAPASESGTEAVAEEATPAETSNE